MAIGQSASDSQLCPYPSSSTAVISVVRRTVLASEGCAFVTALTQKGKVIELSIPSSKREVSGSMKCPLSLRRNRLVKARRFFPSLVSTGLRRWRTKQCKNALSGSKPFLGYLIHSLSHMVITWMYISNHVSLYTFLKLYISIKLEKIVCVISKFRVTVSILGRQLLYKKVHRGTDFSKQRMASRNSFRLFFDYSFYDFWMLLFYLWNITVFGIKFLLFRKQGCNDFNVNLFCYFYKA